MKKLIELWKTDCKHCKEVIPILKELEQIGYEFERYNVETPAGQKVWQDYLDNINNYNMSQGYDINFIYTPTFINPQTKMVLAFEDRHPSREEVIQLADTNRPRGENLDNGNKM